MQAALILLAATLARVLRHLPVELPAATVIHPAAEVAEAVVAWDFAIVISATPGH